MESSLNPKSDPKHGSFFTAHTWNTYNSHTKSLAWNRASKPANTCCWGSTLLAFFYCRISSCYNFLQTKKLAMWDSENAETKNLLALHEVKNLGVLIGSHSRARKESQTSLYSNRACDGFVTRATSNLTNWNLTKTRPDTKKPQRMKCNKLITSLCLRLASGRSAKRNEN